MNPLSQRLLNQQLICPQLTTPYEVVSWMGGMQAQEDSLLFRAGERVPVHEFHYWDTTESGTAFRLEKPLSGRSWQEGYAGRTLYAAFPHLYFAGKPVLAERFIRAAEEYGAEHETA